MPFANGVITIPPCRFAGRWQAIGLGDRCMEVRHLAATPSAAAQMRSQFSPGVINIFRAAACSIAFDVDPERQSWPCRRLLSSQRRVADRRPFSSRDEPLVFPTDAEATMSS